MVYFLFKFFLANLRVKRAAIYDGPRAALGLATPLAVAEVFSIVKTLKAAGCDDVKWPGIVDGA